MDEKAAENKNSFQKKNYITYHCPHCEEPFAEGVLLNIKVICPNCEKLIIILEMTVRRYGSDNLTIEQMHSSKAEAIAAGHAHYFTGKPCKNGHIEIRDTKSTNCLACRQVRYQKNREKILQYMKKHAEENKDKIKKR